ncbi:hypothetical protein DFH07DRAFT_855786 [Mycena maculata]|uniref:Uncharacterized protein n=1 Tax=Mycena maculata TaxID=230809 RepID=A0AAD7MLV8_9AGAR|nr:hypothetical protein DFH07DRAFT_855786 [Mycena maculata]
MTRRSPVPCRRNMSADVSAVSNETSILASLNNLPHIAFGILIAGTFVFALGLRILRNTTLSNVTRNLDAVMASAEWMYFSSAEAGLFDQCDDNIAKDLSQLQVIASELREQSLRASLSCWDHLQAYCGGLPLRIIHCTGDAKILKTRIGIAREAGLRSIKKSGQNCILWTVWNHGHTPT